LNQSPVTGTFYGMLWLTLFFVSGADTLVVGGLLSSFGPATVFAHPEIGFVIVVKSVSVLMGASLQIAAPILAVLFLTQVIIGILVKVAPQVNAFQFSFPLQLILSFGLMTLSLVLLPNFLQGAVHYILAGEQDILRI
ncbi:MAG: flagellar biosynthetic protein FliR, partial [Acidimicrobiales bacterium]